MAPEMTGLRLRGTRSAAFFLIATVKSPRSLADERI